MSNGVHVPIAIVGMSCRLPGGATDPEKLWTMISESQSAWSDVPSDRFNWKSFYHPDSEANGAHNHRGGHFLEEDIAAFDATFFGIPPQEAQAMDPQQRILLETTYEALENAGITLDSIRGSNTAVYVAMFSRDYDRNIFKDASDIPKYHLTGVGEAIVSNRLSYIFDLKGPSMTLDTGCSGSMVALHQACQSLRNGEVDLAIVGGTNLILSPDHMITMSHLQ
jgi:acyl transferase domain-containing protein